MSNSGKGKDNLNFCAHYGPAEKNQEIALASQYLASQSVESSFAGKTKIGSLTISIHGLFKSLRLYLIVSVIPWRIQMEDDATNVNEALCDGPLLDLLVSGRLKVRQSWKKIMVSSILPKNEQNSLSSVEKMLRIVSFVRFLEELMRP